MIASRRAFIDALRSPTLPQATKPGLQHPDGSVCALGLYARQVLGLTLSPALGQNEDAYKAIRRSLDFHGLEQTEVWYLNDSLGLSFAQIADELERKWA